MFERGAALGSAKNMTQLAYCYFAGRGTTKSLPKAIEWYERAAAAGEAMAQNQLGQCYLTGDGVALNKVLFMTCHVAFVHALHGLVAYRARVRCVMFACACVCVSVCLCVGVLCRCLLCVCVHGVVVCVSGDVAAL